MFRPAARKLILIGAAACLLLVAVAVALRAGRGGPDAAPGNRTASTATPPALDRSRQLDPTMAVAAPEPPPAEVPSPERPTSPSIAAATEPGTTRPPEPAAADAGRLDVPPLRGGSDADPGGRPPSVPIDRPRTRGIEPPITPRLVRDVPIEDLLAAPESFAGALVIPAGYFQIGPSINRRSDGSYATYLVAQPSGAICSKGGDPEGVNRLDFVVDREIGEALMRELSTAGRTAASCIPKFEIRPGEGGGSVAAIVQLTLAKFGNFEALYFFRDLNNLNSIALRDSVDVVLLDSSGRYQGGAPASEWEGRIGEVYAGRAKTKMRDRLRHYRAQANRMQMSAQTQLAMQQGLVQGQRNQQSFGNLVQRMFGGQ